MHLAEFSILVLHASSRVQRSSAALHLAEPSFPQMEEASDAIQCHRLRQSVRRIEATRYVPQINPRGGDAREIIHVIQLVIQG